MAQDHERNDATMALEPLRISLFNRVVPKTQLIAETVSFTTQLATGPNRAYGYSWAVYQAAHLHLNEGLRTEELAKLCCLRGSEVKEGITAFNDKRKSSFRAPTEGSR
jgi:hypothetical protein